MISAWVIMVTPGVIGHSFILECRTPIRLAAWATAFEIQLYLFELAFSHKSLMELELNFCFNTSFPTQLMQP